MKWVKKVWDSWGDDGTGFGFWRLMTISAGIMFAILFMLSKIFGNVR